jgi:glycosyltransferase involved in cell wall biosynthesis
MQFKKILSKKDKRVKLLVPKNINIDPAKIELSIVIPAYNEKKTIHKFIEWCKLGIESIKLKNKSEIIIIDSSNDGTDKIALALGAKVVKTPLRGLGRAYLDGMQFVSGKYMILGDADCTYDFKNLKNFYKKFLQGYEFIMGSRRLGNIQTGSMPKLHQYFGIPVTNFLLNYIYNSRFSDIHCGMRGITKKAFLQMELSSQKWDYASEMLIKAIRLNLKLTEIPINFYIAANNRESVHVREGWLSPWKAGFQNLNQMLIFGSDYLFKKIFYFFLFPSVAYFCYTIFISNSFLNYKFHFHWSFSFFTLLIISYLFLFFSGIVKAVYQIGLKKNIDKLIDKKIKYNFFDFIILILGIATVFPTILQYYNNASLDIDHVRTNLFLIGCSFLLLSFIRFFEYFFFKGFNNIFLKKK